jgi:xanthine dehydrogenase accessory factor
MERLFTALRDALRRGEDAVLCTIIASSGSTPRGSGAKMAVFADGSTIGTVGGGAVEYESEKLAKLALLSRATFTHGFNLTKNQTADIGMICGGQVTVYFQFLAGNDSAAIPLLDAIVSLYSRQENAWLITKITDGGVCGMAIYTKDGGVQFCDAIHAEEIQPLICSHAMLKSGEPSYYVEPLTRAETVYVFGGGHVSQELVPVLAHIGFSVVVFEDRETFADPALFPGAVRTVTGSFTDISAQVTVRPDDYVIIMTRGHQADFEVLNQVLRTEASYIGVIGSQHKIAATNKRLVEAGIPESALDRVHTPIGLSIGAETPAEIAISIAAELIAHRAGLDKGE